MAEAKAKPQEDVEHGTFDANQLDKKQVAERFAQKATPGGVTLNEAETRAVAEVLGVTEEVFGPEVEAGPDNPLAGSTPATGSGGTPYRADAATDETKKAAKQAEKAAEKADEPSPRTVNQRRLAASVQE